MDRTDATISDQELQSIHLPPFKGAVDAGVATVMVNSGSVNGEPVHASHHLLTDVLRGQLHFKGLVISDWQDVENLITKYHVAPDMEHAVALAFNAGLDMSMIPLDATGFTTAMTQAVNDGLIPMSRIDDAVSHGLTLKFKLGLFEHPFVDANRANAAVENPANRPLARKAAQESLVLLGNDGVLPFSRTTRKILVTGPASDSPTNQLGGWSVAWQGAFGLPQDIPIPEVTTIREGVQQAAGPGRQVTWTQGAPVADTTRSRNPTYDPLNDAANPTAAAQRAEAVDAAKNADAVVVAVGESPYAETQGDDPNPSLTSAQSALVDALKATGKPVVVVVVAGRPLKTDHQLDEADASLMAFLPGSEGGAAIADALFG
jgi:beta-glucosidase